MKNVKEIIEEYFVGKTHAPRIIPMDLLAKCITCDLGGRGGGNQYIAQGSIDKEMIPLLEEKVYNYIEYYSSFIEE